MTTVPGSVARSLERRLRHSQESTYWNGVLAVSLGPVRNDDDRQEIAVIQLFPRPVCLDLQHEDRICLTSDPDGLRSLPHSLQRARIQKEKEEAERAEQVRIAAEKASKYREWLASPEYKAMRQKQIKTAAICAGAVVLIAAALEISGNSGKNEP